MCASEGDDPEDTHQTPQNKMEFQKFETFKLKSAYQPKTKMTDFEREFAKDIAEYLAEHAAGKMEERIQYLRQNHSGSYHLHERVDNWTQTRTRYNELGNDIRFMSVYGNKSHNQIRMDSETHEFIYGDDGNDIVKGGWGDDVIIGGDFERAYHSRDIDELRGEDGKDTLFANFWDLAYGGNGEDVLVGIGKCWLRGDSENEGYDARSSFQLGYGSHGDRYSDKFVLYTDTTPRYIDNSAIIADFTQADQLIINFGLGRNGEQSKFGGIRPGVDHTYQIDTMVFFDDSNNAVGKIFATDLQGFDLQVNNDGEQLVVTGSEYTQRVLTTGMEFF